MDLLPSLLQGLDLNVHFSAIDAFEFTRAVSLFDAFGLRLLHGWRPLRDKAHRRKAEASAVVGASSAVEAACGAEAAPASLGNVPAETACGEEEFKSGEQRNLEAAILPLQRLRAGDAELQPAGRTVGDVQTPPGAHAAD
ncbi:hypothetical protein cyc_06892 [Cyclospora cayetanensis]|uniref:MINDY deubiquitinase domain-containing protein n=1 Tax=Cyclospora cayetanensis TaxID=88456 RepID=A0A1D3D3L2_9EIME|nr:hypothetical protein cyc_06892 [Cyclospora cayetanensis]